MYICQYSKKIQIFFYFNFYFNKIFRDFSFNKTILLCLKKKKYINLYKNIYKQQSVS